MFIKLLKPSICNVQKWVDYRLTWNVSVFGDTEYILVHSSKIWTPQLLLNNTWEY